MLQGDILRYEKISIVFLKKTIPILYLTNQKTVCILSLLKLFNFKQTIPIFNKKGWFLKYRKSEVMLCVELSELLEIAMQLIS